MTVRGLACCHPNLNHMTDPQSRQDYDATAHISYVLSTLLVIDCEHMSSVAKRCIELLMPHHQLFSSQVGVNTQCKLLPLTRISHWYWPDWMATKHRDDLMFWSLVSE